MNGYFYVEEAIENLRGRHQYQYEEYVESSSSSSTPLSSLVEDVHLRRRILHDEEPGGPGTTILFFLFGAMILAGIWAMARNFRTSEQREEAQLEEEQRRKEEEAVKMVEKRRRLLTYAFQKENLVKVLGATDIIEASRTSSVLGEKKGAKRDIENVCSSGLGEAIDEEEEEEEDNNNTLDGTQDERDAGAVLSEEEERTRSSIKDIENNIATGNAGKNNSQDGVSDSSIIANPEASPCLNNMENDIRNVQVVRDDVPVSIQSICAICLEQYTEGEKLVLSGNPSCTHGFHQECILDYLVLYGKEGGPCPCCRQIFMPVQEIKRGGWKKKDPQQSA